MIDVIEFDDGLPVSVIVPHGRSQIRDNFFDQFVMPMLEANEVIEIVVNDNTGKAPKKRNDGFEKSTQPYVFFCDNDIVLPKDHIRKLYNTLINNPSKGFAYSGYYGIVRDITNHPLKNNFKIPTIPFVRERLFQGNFISTMSLIKRECLPKPKPFDESLRRLQDWDLFLTMAKNNVDGIAVQNNEYLAYYLDDGITSNNNISEQEAQIIVLKKHELI